jgi:hypothetical protein
MKCLHRCCGSRTKDDIFLLSNPSPRYLSRNYSAANSAGSAAKPSSHSPSSDNTLTSSHRLILLSKFYPNIEMSSTPWKPWATKKPDADYDIVDFEDELDDEDTDQQRVHEGQLLQRQPQARGKNVYIQAMSNLMKSASNAIPASTQAFPRPAQKPTKLISHTEIATITPELAGLLAAEGMGQIWTLIYVYITSTY